MTSTTLDGITPAQFTAIIRALFLQAIATMLGVPVSWIRIFSFARRSVSVTYAVLTPNSTVASSVANSITANTESSDSSGLTAIFNAGLANNGSTLTVSGMNITSAPVVTDVPADGADDASTDSADSSTDSSLWGLSITNEILVIVGMVLGGCCLCIGVLSCLFCDGLYGTKLAKGPEGHAAGLQVAVDYGKQ